MSLICISFVLFPPVPLFLLIAPVAKLLVRAGKIHTSDWTRSGEDEKISCFRLDVKSLTRFHMYYCRQSTSHSPLACEPVHIVTHPPFPKGCYICLNVSNSFHLICLVFLFDFICVLCGGFSIKEFLQYCEWSSP